MNHKTLKLSSAMTLLAAVTSLSALADPGDLPVKRGPDIRGLASGCGIGPFAQTSKAGEYNKYCAELTDAEKCLALIKANMNSVGVLSQAYQQPEVVEYCLETFKQGLL